MFGLNKKIREYAKMHDIELPKVKAASNEKSGLKIRVSKRDKPVTLEHDVFE